ncbi:DedA family protein [Candidatus Kaiserbacteria bacterium]|nr:DedA family protein [Candidatus Kaiserbacteria bacterium]
MDTVSQIAMQVLAFIDASKYVLLWLGCYFEGTIVMLTGGVLVQLHQLDFWPTYFVLLSADFFADMTWYYIGYFGARPMMVRWGWLVGVSPEILPKIERRFHTYHTWILVISKLTMGLGLAVGTLMTAGMLRVPVARYAAINFFGGIVWVFLLCGIGFYFGNVLELIPPKLQLASVIAILILSIFGLRLLTQRLAESDW